MAERLVRVASANGLHARPASHFAQAAAHAGMPVQIVKDGRSVNAASILGVISLGIDHGDEVRLIAEGDDAEQVLDGLTTLLSTDFDGN